MHRQGGWRPPPFGDWQQSPSRNGGPWNSGTVGNRFLHPPPHFDPRIPRYASPAFDRPPFSRLPNNGVPNGSFLEPWRGGWTPRGRGGGRNSEMGNGQFDEAPQEYSSKQGRGHFNRGGYRGRGGKRPRIDKRDLPENNQFSCDTCDRGFKTDEKLKEHLAQHVKCSAPGCSYVAAAKLVDMHFAFQHRTGVAKKIWQLESKKDIANWVSERRKNFPTEQNILRKTQEMAERRQRGEILEDVEQGKMRGRGRGGRGHRGRGGFRGQGRSRGYGQRDSKLESDNNVADAPDEFPTAKKLLPDEDPLALLLRDGAPVNDDSMQQRSAGSTVQVTQLGGALGTLVSAYAADDNDEEEEEEEEKVASRSSLVKAKISPIKRKPVPLIPKARLTLLQKLLAPAIRHERNVLFQCIRHITLNNFFDDTSLADISLPSAAADQTPPTDHSLASTSTITSTVAIDDELWDDV